MSRHVDEAIVHGTWNISAFIDASSEDFSHEPILSISFIFSNVLTNSFAKDSPVWLLLITFEFFSFISEQNFVSYRSADQ